MQKIKSVFLVITFSYSLTAFSQSVKINVEKGQKYKVETTSSLSSLCRNNGANDGEQYRFEEYHHIQDNRYGKETV
jgi:hypothetical protein